MIKEKQMNSEEKKTCKELVQNIRARKAQDANASLKNLIEQKINERKSEILKTAKI